MSRQSSTVVAAAVSMLALLGGLWALRRERPAPIARPPAPLGAPEALTGASGPAAAEVEPSAAVPLPAPSTPQAAAPAVNSEPALDEPALMQTLRELRTSDPSRTLQLARDGNQRFKNSPDEAERSWFIVRALSDLGRHEEARVEGRALLDHHHDTRWAEDVYRHLFVNPGTHPFERGYGKQLESDP
jgi:hypothetical protein